jgi:hypothetical protein
MLAWTYSGFSVDLSRRIPRPAAGRSPAGGLAASSRTREALAQYVARPSISLSKMLVEEREACVLYRSEYNQYFKTYVKLFPALEFLVQLLQHLPEPRAHLVRLTPEGRCSGPPKGWKQQHSQLCTLHIGGASEDRPDQSISDRQSRAAPWTTAVSQETARVWA